jgi:hypothetical protein
MAYTVPMLFLLNDVVLILEGKALMSALDMRRFGPLRMQLITTLGQEAFAEEPLLHRDSLAQALRLAALISAKAPEINAALFVAPARNCPPEQVSYRFAQVDFDRMAQLYARQQGGGLTTIEADRQVWKRLAA